MRDNAPFAAVELDISDSAREGCCVGTINVTSEPADWERSVQLAIEEIRRLQRYGVQQAELKRYINAFVMDAELAMEAQDSVESVQNLEILMEFLALDHRVVHPERNHEAIQRIAQTITVEEMHALTRSMLTFGSDYGREAAILEAYRNSEEGEWAEPGPAFATSILACVPEFVDASGNSLGGHIPSARGQNMVTIDHVDIELSNEELPEIDEEEDFEVPENAVRFELTENDIRNVLMDQSVDVEPLPEINVPEKLVSEADLEHLIQTRKPKYVPLERGSEQDPTVFVDPHSNVVCRRLSNGIRLNFLPTDYERKIMMIRVVFPGGGLQNGNNVGPSGFGAVQVGVQTLSQSRKDKIAFSVVLGCFRDVGRMESRPSRTLLRFELGRKRRRNDGRIYRDQYVTAGDQSSSRSRFRASPSIDAISTSRQRRRRPCQTNHHLVLPVCAAAVMRLRLSCFRTNEKSLEDASEMRLAAAMMGDDRRLMDPMPSDVEALTIEGMTSVVLQMLNTQNMEVTFVGDFDMEQIQNAALRYLGTLDNPVLKPDYLETEKSVQFCEVSGNRRHQVWHLEDSDERAVGYICGPAPSYWGPFESKQWPPEKPAKVTPSKEAFA